MRNRFFGLCLPPLRFTEEIRRTGNYGTLVDGLRIQTAADTQQMDREVESLRKQLDEEMNR